MMQNDKKEQYNFFSKKNVIYFSPKASRVLGVDVPEEKREEPLVELIKPESEEITKVIVKNKCYCIIL
jgi:hypothetical protein